MQRALSPFDNLKKNLTKPNVWDVAALLLILGLVCSLAWLAKQMVLPYHTGDKIPISLDPSNLPRYAFRTVLRMVIALGVSLTFTFAFGTLAAKNKLAEQIIIPLVDILQSVPILGFLSLTVVGFITLFPGSLLGPECASIFAIFTSQAWNMTLSLYQSLRTVPLELKEAANSFQLSAWQRYWRVEVPFSIPSLLWNMMMSMSGGWFFVVASEAISVSNQDITLPGIGSYINKAIQQGDTLAIFYALLSMLFVIMIYDQLFFRPLLCWSEKFKPIQDSPGENSTTWLTVLLKKTRVMKVLASGFSIVANGFINLGATQNRKSRKHFGKSQRFFRTFRLFWYLAIIGLVVSSALVLILFLYVSLSASEIEYVLALGWITGLKVFVLIALCSLLWVPVGVWIGMRPSATNIAQPIVQFIAAFPANLLYPVFVYCIIHFQLNPNLWTAPLMILGSQWYIVFNVIAGASALPKDLYQATANLGVTGWLWWRKFILPGIFPFYITGAITAAGGAWNASIIAEYLSWKGTTIKVMGLGAYITEYTHLGLFPHIALGISVMCFYVLIINRVIWQPLYHLAEERFQCV